MTSEKDIATLAKRISQEHLEYQEQFLLLTDIYSLKAKQARMRYLAFIREGFTEVQALAMCRHD